MTHVKFAFQHPTGPSVEQLHAQHGLTPDEQQQVLMARSALAAAIRDPHTDLVDIVGPCSMSAESATAGDNTGVTLFRIPPWKPRSRAGDWNGLETTQPEETFRIMAGEARSNANVATELGHPEHLDRYRGIPTLGWLGSRAISASPDEELSIGVTVGDLLDAAVSHDLSLPLGVKNGIDGSIDGALAYVERVNRERSPQDAPAVLIFRGGANLTTPELWRAAVREAHARTGGRFIVDVAHGSEMAFDPNHAFTKSEAGQRAALEALIALADQEGISPVGVMVEASNVRSLTDPVLPMRVALDGVERLALARRRQLLTGSRV